jgi:hypothetical protein
MRTLQESIDRLGVELVRCTDGCSGIRQEQTAGFVPRLLILDRPDAKGRGCLAIGFNPGRSDQAERDFYLKSSISYKRLKKYWLTITTIDYVARTRQLIDQIGLTGPIIWSNVAKCEKAAGRSELPPMQTMRHCASRFLCRELELAPHDWAVLAIGSGAYDALSYLAMTRTIIGIPHTTGGGGVDFNKMFGTDGLLQKDIKKRARQALKATEPIAVWLGTNKREAAPPNQFDRDKGPS